MQRSTQTPHISIQMKSTFSKLLENFSKVQIWVTFCQVESLWGWKIKQTCTRRWPIHDGRQIEALSPTTANKKICTWAKSINFKIGLYHTIRPSILKWTHARLKHTYINFQVVRDLECPPGWGKWIFLSAYVPIYIEGIERIKSVVLHETKITAKNIRTNLHIIQDHA